MFMHSVCDPHAGLQVVDEALAIGGRTRCIPEILGWCIISIFFIY